MRELLSFIEGFEEGATEEQICRQFPRIRKVELAAILNNMLQSAQIEVYEADSKIFYKALENKTLAYESMILGLLGQSGSTGTWLRDIKVKTNIPHNLILKILRSLEASQKIKTVKSVRNNRKMYMLYDISPAEEITGGVWFSNGDVDLVFVNKLMDLIHQYCARPEDEFTLPRIESLPRLSEVSDYIGRSGISEVELSRADLAVLIDCLVYDGRLEKYSVDGDTVLRSVVHLGREAH